MDHQLVINMKNIFIILFLLLSFILKAQDEETYFIIDGEKFIKPIKYLLFNPHKDSKSNVGNICYFHMGNERFQFINTKHTVDTLINDCSIKIQYNDVEKLSNDEKLFIEKKIKERNLWDFRALYLDPQIEFHPYFSIFILEKRDNLFIKYEVDWDYTGTRGLRENPSVD